jgi:outer membrane protein assembly factor BamD
MQQFQDFLEYYPQSNKKEEVQQALFEMQEKLAYKEFLGAKLYYNLGTYMGNNFASCIITAENALKSYPDTKYREELIYLVICSKYELAIVSVDERLQGRYRDVVDEYYSYLNEFPEGKYIRQVKRFYDYASEKIERNY